MHETDAELAQIATFQAQVTGAAERLTSMLTTLANELAPVEAYMRGLGAGAFQSTSATVYAQTKRMNQALNGIAADVGTAGVKYGQGDEELRQELQKPVSAITETLAPAPVPEKA